MAALSDRRRRSDAPWLLAAAFATTALLVDLHDIAASARPPDVARAQPPQPVRSPLAAACFEGVLPSWRPGIPDAGDLRYSEAQWDARVPALRAACACAVARGDAGRG